jgi:hypothetical protein
VIKVLLKEIIPMFGLPNSIQSDSRPSYLSEMTQKMSKVFQITENCSSHGDSNKQGK